MAKTDTTIRIEMKGAEELQAAVTALDSALQNFQVKVGSRDWEPTRLRAEFKQGNRHIGTVTGREDG